KNPDSETKKDTLLLAREALAGKRKDAVQSGKLGVDLAVLTNNLRAQEHLEKVTQKLVGGRRMLEIDGVWIDDGLDAKMPTVTVKALSEAYFRLLERQPQLKELFQLGTRLVWVAPSGTVLIVDPERGQEKVIDEQVDKLFARK